MRKILIADASYELCEAIAKQLGKQYCVTYCNDGDKVFEIVNNTDPDVLVLDLMLPYKDGLTVLGMLRSAGKNMPVLVLTTYLNDYIASALAGLHVSYVCRKPCSVETLVCSIRSLADDTGSSLWVSETKVDNLLMMLGFRIGPSRYENVRTAILLRYYGGTDGMTKSLYPAVAASNGGNALQVEKSIRDAIRHAYQQGNRSLWAMYFPFNKQNQCPSNETFITRIAYALQTRERLPEAPSVQMC